MQISVQSATGEISPVAVNPDEKLKDIIARVSSEVGNINCFILENDDG